VENAAKEEEACIKRERFKREKMRRNGIIFPHKNCPVESDERCPRRLRRTRVSHRKEEIQTWK
jgi:hypothetical protein